MTKDQKLHKDDKMKDKHNNKDKDNKMKDKQDKNSFLKKFIWTVTLTLIISGLILSILPYIFYHTTISKLILDDHKLINIEKNEYDNDDLEKDSNSVIHIPINRPKIIYKVDENLNQSSEKNAEQGEEEQNEENIIKSKDNDLKIELKRDNNAGANAIKINYSILSEDFRRYRLYLQNFYKLISKFEQNKPYTAELSYLNEYDFPDDLKEIVSFLDSYNQRLNLDKIRVDNIVNLFSCKLLKNFMTIEHRSNKINKKENLRAKHRRYLKNLSDYIFSSQMQDSFFNK